MGNAKKIARQIVAEDGRPPLFDPRDEDAECSHCGNTLPAGTDPIDMGWTSGPTDGEFICNECLPTEDGDGVPYTDDVMTIIKDGLTPPTPAERAKRLEEMRKYNIERGMPPWMNP